jgi:hypothetical protein
VSKTFYHTLITLIRERSAYCMLLTGPAGCGKTTLMHALYDKALRPWASDSVERGEVDQAVWKVGALQLSHEQREFVQLRQPDDPPVPIPTVTRGLANIAVAHAFVPHVSIDELDKYSATGFQAGS